MKEHDQADKDLLISLSFPFVAFCTYIIYNVYYSCFVVNGWVI